MDSSVVDLRTLQLLKNRVVALGAIALVIVLIVSPRFCAMAQYLSEYERYVHNYMDSEVAGNWTYLEKPMFPILLHDLQVPVGQNWSIVCPLASNHSYHVYCYGKWVDNSSEPKTDYDIYVYDPSGKMESYHTESAGLPEHLGTTVNDAFFLPKCTGNYTFVIVNDSRESKGAKEATFMIIEDIQSNVWHEHWVEGKDNQSMPELNTSWAYEFVTESQHIEVYIKVPETLDMYEARLYLMSDPQSLDNKILNDVPLAWEYGLYGNRSTANSALGGYNLESKEYRGASYASCEYYGQDMFLNFTTSFVGKTLYHLVFIGETGFGTINFLVKTEFNNVTLRPSIIPGRMYPSENGTVAYVSSSTDLKNATLRYSIDSWRSMNTIDMEISNRTCTAIIPGQVAGTSVYYVIDACDILENAITVNGSYPVKYASMLNFSSPQLEVRVGENVTVAGFLDPRTEGMPVEIYLSSANETKEIACYTLEDGTFSVSFKQEAVGSFMIYARFNGSSSLYESESSLLILHVDQPLLVKYAFYIFGATGAIIAVGMAVYMKKSKG
jgi:hypothetical protein